MIGDEVPEAVDVVVKVDEVSNVAEVRICRPPNNFLDTALIRTLADTLEALSRSMDARAVVLCSEGKHFCAGRNFSKARGEGDSPSDLYTEAARLLSVSIPWVAAVQGAAVGGGFGLALAADFRVLAENARLAPSFVALGTHHGFGLTALLPRVVGAQRAAELLLTGENVDGARAKELGLADRVVPDESLLSEAHSFASRLAATAPLALRSIRASLRQGLVDDFQRAVERESAEQARLSGTADFKEGTAAARERRRPNFEGR